MRSYDIEDCLSNLSQCSTNAPGSDLRRTPEQVRSICEEATAAESDVRVCIEHFVDDVAAALPNSVCFNTIQYVELDSIGRSQQSLRKEWQRKLACHGPLVVLLQHTGVQFVDVPYRRDRNQITTNSTLSSTECQHKLNI